MTLDEVLARARADAAVVAKVGGTYQPHAVTRD